MNLILDVLVDNMRSYCITYSSDKICIALFLPHLQSSPKLLRFPKYFSSRCNLHYLHQLSRQIIWQRFDKYMNTITHGKSVLPPSPREWLSNSFRNFTKQNFLRYPYKNCMLNPSRCRTLLYHPPYHSGNRLILATFCNPLYSHQ